MITPQEAQAIRARLAAFDAWRGPRTSYRTEDIPVDVPHPTNDEISALEIFNFVNDPPNKYFCYIAPLKQQATTWTGETLGTITLGRSWRSNFGDTRQSVTLYAINGRIYKGIYYRSTGDYARVRLSH